MQQISEQISEEKMTRDFDDIVREISCDNKLDKKDIDNKIIKFCEKMEIKLDPNVMKRKKESYKKKKEAMFTKAKTEIENVKGALKKGELDIKNNINLVENKLLPQINAVNQTIEEYENNLKEIIKQFNMLLQAEDEVQKQIKELGVKKYTEENNINEWFEEIDGTLQSLYLNKEGKCKEIERLKALTLEYDSEAKIKTENSKHDMMRIQNELKSMQEELEKAMNVVPTQEQKLIALNKEIEDIRLKMKKNQKQIEKYSQKLNNAKPILKSKGSQLLANTMQKVLAKSLQAEQNSEYGVPEVVCFPLQTIDTINILNKDVYSDDKTTLSSKCTSGKSSFHQPSIPNYLKYSNRSSSRGSFSKKFINTTVSNRTVYIDPKLNPNLTENDYQLTTEPEKIFRNSLKELSNYNRTEGNSSPKKNIWDIIKKQHLRSFTQSETNVFNLIEPLLKGQHFYKKFSKQFSNTMKPFDPLETEEFPPDRCGYGLRYLCLSKDFRNLIIKQSQESSAHYSIPITSIEKPIIPQKTIEIIKFQKKAKIQNHMNAGDIEESYGENTGMINKIAKAIADKSILKSPKSEENYKKKCANCKYFPFWYKLVDNGRIDLIATEYGILKTWVIGISTLLKNQAVIEKFKSLAGCCV